MRLACSINLWLFAPCYYGEKAVHTGAQTTSALRRRKSQTTEEGKGEEDDKRRTVIKQEEEDDTTWKNSPRLLNSFSSTSPPWLSSSASPPQLLRLPLRWAVSEWTAILDKMPNHDFLFFFYSQGGGQSCTFLIVCASPASWNSSGWRVKGGTRDVRGGGGVVPPVQPLAS